MANVYSAALEQAKADLTSINGELQELIARKNSLENAVKLLASLGMNAEPAGAHPDLATILRKNGSDPSAPEIQDCRAEHGRDPAGAALPVHGEFLWKQIALVMRSVAKFTIAEAGEAVEKARGTSMGHTRSQQVRNAIVRHEDKYFRHNPDNTWSVMKEAVE